MRYVSHKLLVGIVLEIIKCSKIQSIVSVSK